MTDFRALCAELLDEMDYYTDWSDAKEVKDRARAALAEPQPNPPAEREVAELVTWLLDGGEDAAANGWDHQARQFGRAAELLQRLQPEPPTKVELKQLFDDHSGYIDDEQVMWWSDFHAAALAALARWGGVS